MQPQGHHGSGVQPTCPSCQPLPTVLTWPLSSPLPSLQANLFPAALVYFGAEEPTGRWGSPPCSPPRSPPGPPPLGPVPWLIRCPRAGGFLWVWEGDLWPHTPIHYWGFRLRQPPAQAMSPSGAEVVGGAPLLPDLGLGLLQCSTWSPGCWNTRFPHLQLMCWWPGECPQRVGGPLLQRWHHSFPLIHSVCRCISRASVTPSPPPAPDSAPAETQPAAEDAVGPLEPSPRAAQPVRRDLGKVPKWLKLPGTVGGGRAGRGCLAGTQDP